MYNPHKAWKLIKVVWDTHSNSEVLHFRIIENNDQKGENMIKPGLLDEEEKITLYNKPDMWIPQGLFSMTGELHQHSTMKHFYFTYTFTFEFTKGERSACVMRNI